jgi:hypothetical protein
MLKPLLQLRHILVARKPRDRIGSGMLAVGRNGQALLKVRRLRHLVEREGAFNTWIRPKSDHRVGKICDDTASFVDDAGCSPAAARRAFHFFVLRAGDFALKLRPVCIGQGAARLVTHQATSMRARWRSTRPKLNPHHDTLRRSTGQA